MGIFNVNFSQLWKDLLPPELQKPKTLAWGTSLMKPLQYLRDIVFDDYKQGSQYPMYSNTSAYTANDRVIYTNRRAYESVSGSTGVLPTSNSWRLISENYIGVDERIKYNSQKILFEFGLNRWFQCSGIYITNTPVVNSGLLMGNAGEYSSPISRTSNPSATYLSNTFTGVTVSCFTINVPNIVLTGLGPSYTEQEKTIRSFADEYTLAGMLYSVSGY